MQVSSDVQRLLLAPALVCGLAVMLSSGCGSPPAEEPEVNAAPARAVEAVETTLVRKGEIEALLPATGSVIARRETAIGPAVPGRILHIFVDLGDEVLFGSPLFQIDPGPYAIALQNAEAGLALAQAELNDARVDAKRTNTLRRKDMISSQENTRAVTRRAVAEARVAQAEARLAAVRHDLNRTLVLAPYQGSIVERGAHEGTMGTVTPNTRVVVLQESSALEAALDVPEASHVPARPGDAARLWIEGVPDPITSQVRAVSDRIDRKTRTYAVRVPVADPERRIKAGAFVRAEITPAPRVDTLLVDPSCVLRQDGRTFVFRVVDGLAEQVEVRAGITSSDAIEILDGLASGDRVVIGDAVGRLTDGSPVELSERETPARSAAVASTAP